MDWIAAFEMFSMVTGVIYLVLEVLQKDFMWVVGILTAAAAVVCFSVRGLYASMALNVYYVGVSVLGLIRWRKDREAVPEGVHLRRLSLREGLWSAVALAAGTAVFYFILRAAGDPAPFLDGFVAVLSAVATWWLTRSIPEQWLIWIVADTLSAVLCAAEGLPWMTALYVFYMLSAVYGWFHWKKQGSYV